MTHLRPDGAVGAGATERSEVAASGALLPAIGERVGLYRLDHVLGRGGMGVVYAATHQQDGGAYAVKVLDPELVADGLFRRRFAREAENAKRIVHPNAVRTFDHGEDDGLAWIAMELVEGQTLGELVKKAGRRRPVEVAQWITQLASVLDHVHAMGIVHRDLKPSNVMLQDYGSGAVVRLLDFGLARDLAQEAHVITLLGSAAGTPGFMAPEQRSGAPAAACTDVFSLAAMAAFLLVGRIPVAAWASPLTTRQFGRIRPWPSAVDAALSAALEPDAARRTATAGAFARAFARAVAEWPPGWAPEVPGEDAPETVR